MKKKIVTMIICSVAFFNGMEYAMNMFGGMIGGQLGEKVLVYAYNAGDFMAGTGAEGSDDGLMLWVKAVANIGLLLIVGLYLWKNNKNIRQYEGGLNLYLVGCILYISTMSINHAFARLSIYYNVFQVPMLLFLVSKGKYKTGYRIMCWMFLFVYIVFRFSVNMAAGPEIKYFWE